MKIKVRFAAVRAWSLRKRILVGFAVSLVAGFVRIEWLEFGTGDLWKAGPVSLLYYAFLGAGSIFLLGILAGVGLFTLGVAVYFGVYAVMISVAVILALVGWVLSLPRRIVALPGQVAQWVIQQGRRGFIGFGLVGGFVVLSSGVWFWLGGFSVEGAIFWFEAALIILVLSMTAGFVGGFGAFLLVDSLDYLSGGRIPEPRSGSKLEETIIASGGLAGTAVVWFLGAGESIARSADVAGVAWRNPWVIWVVTYSYAAACVGLWHAIQRFRDQRPEILVDRGDATDDTSNPATQADRNATHHSGFDETHEPEFPRGASGQLQLWDDVRPSHPTDAAMGTQTRSVVDGD